MGIRYLGIAAALAFAPPVPAQPAPLPEAPAPEPCAASGGLLPGSGLCRADALARLPQTRRNAWTAPVGCDVTAQEAALPGGAWLLFAAQRCGDQIARLETASGPHGEIVLRYTTTARNHTLLGKTVLTLVQGQPEPFVAVRTLVFADLQEEQAKHCDLRVPDVEGYPIDAYVFDLPAKQARKAAALDAPCGPYGRSATFDGYWRMVDGYGLYFAFGDDQPEFDPASLAIYKPGG